MGHSGFVVGILVCISFLIFSCGTQPNGVEKVQYETVANAALDENLPDIRSDWEKANPEMVAKIQEISKNLPTRDYNEMMMVGIPDLSTEEKVSKWQLYTNVRNSLGAENILSKTDFIISRNFTEIKNRVFYLNSMINKNAGFIQANPDGASLWIYFPYPSFSLYLNDGKYVESAEIWTDIVGLANIPDNAKWVLVNENKMADGITFARYELTVNNIRVLEAAMEFIFHYDSLNKKLWIGQAHLLSTYLYDLKLPNTENVDEQDFKDENINECVKNSSTYAVQGDEFKLSKKGALVINCKENECKLVRWYVINAYDNYKGKISGSISCFIDIANGNVFESRFERVANYTNKALWRVAEPYYSNDPPDIGDGNPDYGFAYNGAAYAEVVGADYVGGQWICDPTDHIGWASSDGTIETSSSGTMVCIIPDARANNPTNNHPDIRRFRHCPKTDYASCDGTETQDSNIILSPPLAAWNPFWNENTYQRRHAQYFYHLNWIRDLFADVLPNLYCKSGGANKFVDYHSPDSFGAACSPSNCALDIARWDNSNGVWSAPWTIYHEYMHIVDMNMRSNGDVSGYGSAYDRPGVAECRWPNDRNLWWGDRKLEGTAEADNIYDLFETMWYELEENDPKYPSSISISQYAETYMYLSWLVGLPNVTRSLFIDTGLRPFVNNNTNKCKNGKVYLSGFSVRDTRNYQNSSGGDTTNLCACYRSSDPCGCGSTQIPDHRSEREDAALAIVNSGITIPLYYYEVDRSFNARSTESGAKWTDDVTNIWYSGQLIGNVSANPTSNETISYYYSPDYPASYLTINSLPTGWDDDNFSFFPGYGETYTISAISNNGNVDLELYIFNSNYQAVAYNDNCNGGTLNPCITWTGYDANYYYIRVQEKSSRNCNYYINFRHVNDDHNDYAPEGTPLTVSDTTYHKGTIEQNDTDYFRTFIPDNSVYYLNSLVVSVCSLDGTNLQMTLFNSQPNSSGRFVDYENLGSIPFSNSCTTWSSFSFIPPGGGHVPQGWYFIKINAVTGGQTGGYRVKIGDDPTTSMSSASDPMPLSTYWDIMYNDTTQNRVFRGAGILSTAASEDWYEIDLTSSTYSGRLVVIDVIGLDDGSGGNKFDPIVELHSGTNTSSDNGYYDQISSISHVILNDDDGGLVNYNSYLTFRVLHPQKYRIKIKPYSSSTVGKPYQLFVDVKKASLAYTAIGWN